MYDQSYGQYVYYNGQKIGSSPGAGTSQPAQGVYGPGTPNAGQGWTEPGISQGGSPWQFPSLSGGGGGIGSGIGNFFSNLGTGTEIILLGGLAIVVLSFAMNHRSR